MTVELPDEVEINLDSLTLGDLEDVEELTGASFSALVNTTGGMPVKGLRALAFVSVRRDIPELTYEDCRGFRQGAIKVKDNTASDPQPPPEGGGAQ